MVFKLPKGSERKRLTVSIHPVEWDQLRIIMGQEAASASEVIRAGLWMLLEKRSAGELAEGEILDRVMAAEFKLWPATKALRGVAEGTLGVAVGPPAPLFPDDPGPADD